MPVGPTADFSSIAMDDREGSNALNMQSGVTITCLSAQPARWTVEKEDGLQAFADFHGGRVYQPHLH